MTITAVIFLIVVVSSCCVDAHPMSGSTPQIERPAAQKAEQPGDLSLAAGEVQDSPLVQIFIKLFASEEDTDDDSENPVQPLVSKSAGTAHIKDIIISMSDLLRNLKDLARQLTADDVPILQFGNSAPESGGTLKPASNMNDLPGNLGAGNLPNVIGGGAGGH